MTDIKHIPFEVETSRIIELLAKQIYQSPMALLRENVQNAFDAVRERLQQNSGFDPLIDVTIESERIVIMDNGIGMSPDELEKHFWTAGSSSKNTPQARAAGVVGTFGIGAMANFGVASCLIVETESGRTGERTVSTARRDALSLKNDCVEVRNLEPTGRPGTTITAELAEPGSVNVTQAQRYVGEFVRHLVVPVRVNETLVSQVPLERTVPEIPTVHHELLQDVQIGSQLRASGELTVSPNAMLRLVLSSLQWNGRALVGHIALYSGGGALQTARSGFGLAIVPVSSVYNFGGVADLQILEPTAGREAVTSEGVQLLQAMTTEIDDYASLILSGLEQCNSSTQFMQWAFTRGRYDILGKLTIERAGSNEISLADAVALSSRQSVQVYGGVDPTVIKMFSSEGATLLVLSRTSPRRQCQEGYLARSASISTIPDRPTVSVLKEGADLGGTQWGVAYRIETIIEEDYFVSLTVAFATISHGVSVLLEAIGPAGKPRLVLSSGAPAVTTLVQVFETQIDAFRSFAKDFVRNAVFPYISQLVPSSTRQGAEAFIEAMRRKRETFEYDIDESDELPSIWKEYREGRITLESAIDRTKIGVRTNVQVVDTTSFVHDVVPDLLLNEGSLQQQRDHSIQKAPEGQAIWPVEPPILRTEVESSAKLLTIDQAAPGLRDYRCFIALSPRAYTDFGDFFTQPHSTSVVWGGQKAMFIFIHHSGEFGVYYDMQTGDFVAEKAGGGSQPTCTMVLRNKVYIPIPQAIQASFIPLSGEKKRFEIKADLIRIGSSRTSS